MQPEDRQPEDVEEGELEGERAQLQQEQQQQQHAAQAENGVAGGRSVGSSDADRERDRHRRSKESKKDRKNKETEEERRARKAEKEERRARREAEGKSHHRNHKSATREREEEGVPEARMEGYEGPLHEAKSVKRAGEDEDGHGASKRPREVWEGQQADGKYAAGGGRGYRDAHGEEEAGPREDSRRGESSRRSSRRGGEEEELEMSRQRSYRGSRSRRERVVSAEEEERVLSGKTAGGSAREESRRSGGREESSRHYSSRRGTDDDAAEEDRAWRRREEERYAGRLHREDKYSSRREEDEARYIRRHRDEDRERDREREKERERGRDRRDQGEADREGRRDRGGREERREREKGDERHRSSKRQWSPQEEEVPLPEETQEDEAAAIAARRSRIAALKAKHEQQASIINPTATALQQQEVSVPLSGQAPSMSVPVSGQGASGAVGTAAHMGAAQPTSSVGTPTVDQQQQAGMDVDDDGDGDGEAEDTATRHNALRAGTVTPEGDRSSSEEPEGGLRPGPMLQIWGTNETSNMAGGPDEADSGAPTGAGAKGPTLSAGGATSSGGLALTEENAGKTTAQERIQATAATTAKHKLAEADDMFAEELSGDDDDMFAERPERGDEGEREREGGGALRHAGGGALKDAYDDHEGYYNFQVGEVMDKRYEVFACHGKGVFSIVVRARDVSKKDALGQHPEVAIKLIRSNETMYKAAQMELAVLHKLGQADLENRKHCIRLLRYFEYRNHMCLVFEPMAFNLRELTKKYGRNKGLNVEAVQLFSCQLLIALRHLKKNEVLHADIKPDNILINQRHNKVKLCDFGSAMMAGENDVTPYLVSRFYRPPEVILGMKYDYALDMWSVGSVIYELFTGRILFPGHSNNQMLKLMMDVKGGFTKKMLRKCVFADKHFEMHDPSCPFISLEDDPITKTKVRKLVTSPAVKHNFTSLLSHCSGDKSKVAMLADLLEKMMMLEPERRIDPDTALRHPFVKAFLPKKEHQHGSKRH